MTKLFRYGALLLLVLALAGPAAGQELPPGFDETFAVSSVDPQLLFEAPDAVVRLDLQRFEAAGPGKAVHKVRRAVTILTPAGREHGRLVVFYDKMRTLKGLQGAIRDARGEVVRKLKRSDRKDYSAISDFSLYDDNRVEVAELYHDTYPYTVEYEYELRYDGVVHWPTWYPQPEGEPVAFARFEIEAPEGMTVRYRLSGVGVGEPEVLPVRGGQVWRWEASGLPARVPEPYGPSWREQAAAVHTAPTAFEVQGARGDMSSWESFGRWYYGLAEGRTELPPEVRSELQQLVGQAESEREKVRWLYERLQATTRYVSVQLGLGGWQPFDAAYVHERGYGDCKALTNYMQAMLQAVGIASCPALIRSGQDAPDVLADFPSNQFNHVVLFVPLAADTLWLECTSQTMPFGRLGAGNEDRYALVVTPEGGRLVPTPQSPAEANRQHRRGRVRLDADGNAVAEVRTRYTGNQQDRVRQALAQHTGRDRERWLHRQLDLPSFRVVRADFASVDARDEEILLPLELELPRYAARTGKRLFLQPNLMERWVSVPPEGAERTLPVRFFPYAFADVDSIAYELPAGFALEAAPEPVLLEAPFGRYEAAVALQPGGTLTYRRQLEITEAELPAEQYEALRAFLREVARADRAQVVLVQE